MMKILNTAKGSNRRYNTEKRADTLGAFRAKLSKGKKKNEKAEDEAPPKFDCPCQTCLSQAAVFYETGDDSEYRRILKRMEEDENFKKRYEG